MRDEEIVEMLWHRDEDAISRMEENYGNYCYDISYRIVQNREDASECLNDTWFQTWKSVPANRPLSLRAYVAKIIRNLSLNRVIRQNAFRRGCGETPAVYEELEEMLGGKDETQEMVDRQVFTELLNTFLDGLTQRDRNIFVLRFWYFYDPQEIAEKYGMKEKAVYNVLYRLRRQFQEYWKEQTGGKR